MATAEQTERYTWQPQDVATQVDDGVWLIDLGFQGRRGVVAAYLLAGGGDLALIETGPSTTLPNLEAGIRAAGFVPEGLTHLLLTHIHLDHAGAAGPLVRSYPRARVFVHPVGAPHLIDPTKLLASATRIYGDQMGPLWGEVAPVPAGRVVALTDDGELRVAGRTLRVLFTPGHASHHVAYGDAETGAAFTGDVGGIRMPGTAYVCPPTPPPDLDPDAWHASIDRLRSLRPRRLYPTHFGPFDDAPAHLDRLAAELDLFLAIAGETLAAAGDQPTLTARLHDRMAAQLGPVPPDLLTNLEWATPSYMGALGLTRYLTKRGGQADRRTDGQRETDAR
jgi:glyoxylase-like metal-dependent hydrolase (beta-lactamase superfamily II)